MLPGGATPGSGGRYHGANDMGCGLLMIVLVAALPVLILVLWVGDAVGWHPF